MAFIDFDNRRIYAPGVYSRTRVSSSLPGPLPQFHTPIICGHATTGHGYDARAKSVTGETQFDFYKECRTESEVGAYFGVGSDIHRAAKVAFRHGLPMGYFVALSPMTRASLLVDNGGGSPTSQFTLHAKAFGPVGGWTKIKYATADDILSIRPVKRYAMLSSNLGSSATRANIAGGGIHSWLTEGAVIVVGSNAVAGASKTITKVGVDIAANGQRQHWIEIDASMGSACNTSDYAMVLQYEDTTISSPALTTSQGLIDYLNGDGGYPESAHLFAVKHASFTNAQPADVASETPLKEITAWDTATAGTAPATVDSDATSLVALLDGGAWDRFLNTEQLIPQAFLWADGDDTRHGTMRDYAIARRTAGYPISVTTGCNWGDIVVGAGDTTAPEFRAITLNSQDVALCANGGDREAAALSTAAAVFGRRVAGGPGHNLTNDELLFGEWETTWTPTQRDTLLKRGVITTKLSVGNTIAYKLSQGSSTLQANAVIWNVNDKTTWSVHQRDLADAIDKAFGADVESELIGADEVSPGIIAGRLLRKAEQMERKGWIRRDTYSITSIVLNDAGNGYDVTHAYFLPALNDYITLTNTIMVG